MKKIWILWGMWPQASLHFYEILVEKVSNHIVSPRNQDYPSLLLSNIPVPDQIKDRDNTKITIDMVNREAKYLENAWAEFLVMTCNTMHLFKNDIMQWVQIPFISMIDCVTEKIQKLGIKKVWLLWSSTTMQSQLYTYPLDSIWVEVIVPKVTEHDTISQIILNYIAWKSKQNDIELLNNYCDELIKRWSKAIILWCTELPLILKNNLWEYNFIISSETLAAKTLEYSKT